MKNSYLKKMSVDRFGIWKNKKPVLSHLDLELTERCNNDCIHCYINLPADDSQAKKRELSGERIKGILAQAADLGCLSVRFTGGEPLLKEEFEDIYVFSRKQGLRVNLFTNATLLSPSLVRLFTKIPPLEKIEVTLYGMSRPAYESVTRNPGSFDAAQKGIQLLLDNKIPVEVKSVYLPQNRKEVKRFEKWAASVTGAEREPAVTLLLDLRCRRDSETMNERIRKLRISPEEALEFLTRNGKAYREENREFLSRFAKIPGDILFPCQPGVDSGCVDAYGRYQLCMQLRHPDTVYDLNDRSLQEAVLDFSPKVRSMKAVNPEYLTRCARCFLYGFCEQCPAESWMEHGTLDTPVEYFCRITHLQAKWLGLLRDSEMTWEVEDWKERVERFTQNEE